jgi:hypothetical protein
LGYPIAFSVSSEILTKSMKNKLKLVLAASLVAIAVISCNTKPAEQPDSDGKDSIVTDTTANVVEDTVQVSSDTTAAKQ